MLESHESTPWYRSLAGLIASSILLPPVGIVLLWKRRSGSTATKILATLCIMALGAGYVYLFMQWRKRANTDSHYAVLEQHRAQQQQQAAQPEAAAQPLAANVQQPASASAEAAASPSTESASAHAGQNYWTDY